MREWNLEESFKPVYVGIGVSLILGTASFFAIDLVLSSTLYAFYVWIMVSFFMIGGTLYPLLRRQDRRLTSTHKGYNQKPVDRPFFLFGSAEYNRYRIDEGVMQSMVVGYDPHRQKLDKLERKQRDGQCKVCGDDVHEQFAPNSDPFYAVESRRVYRVFGVPLRERIVDWDVYCSKHKPVKFE